MNIADSEVPFLGLIEHTNMLPKEWYGGNNVLYITNYLDRSDALFKMSKDELLDLYLPHLTKFNPEFDHSWIKAVHYNSVSAAQPIIGTNYSKVIPDHRTPIKRLYLANTTQVYPEDRGTNYSIRMGRELATMILDDEKQGWANWR
jgi:protoporphyrinogen oxidase